MTIKLPYAILILVVILAGAFMFQFSQQETQDTSQSNAPTKTLLPSIDVSTSNNWVPFTSKQYGFRIQYPLDVKNQTTKEGELFYKQGPTQSTGTELFDGISVSIKTGPLGDQTLDSFVKKQYNAMRYDPLQPQLGEIKRMIVGSSQGFSFRVSSMGEGTYIYLPKGEKEYFEIINNTVEPSDREQTFQKTVDQMLSTLKPL